MGPAPPENCRLEIDKCPSDPVTQLTASKEFPSAFFFLLNSDLFREVFKAAFIHSQQDSVPLIHYRTSEGTHQGK